MKDTAKLLVYFVAVLAVGSLLAPILFSLGQLVIAHGSLESLASYGFGSYFDRAILLAAIVLFWPLFRSLRIQGRRDLGLEKNARAARDVNAGFLIAAIPLLLVGGLLIALHIYSVRQPVLWHKMPVVFIAAVVVPLLEELLFRGFILGVLLRQGSRIMAILLSSALFAVVHFMKSPTLSAPNEHNYWFSGFIALAHSFLPFNEPLLILGGFLTLFAVGCVLADARLLTRSLWLPIGLHAGWIFAVGAFSRIAHREAGALPWLGKNLLVGLVPLSIVLTSWALTRFWINYAGASSRESFRGNR